MTDLDEQLAAVEARTAEETAKTKTLEARADDGHLHKRITNAFEKVDRQRRIDTGEIVVKRFAC